MSASGEERTSDLHLRGDREGVLHLDPEAKLPDRCCPHGLRKAAARRLAEAGCTPHEIMAATGYKSLKEVVLYTAAASQVRLADAAVATLGPHERRTIRG